MRLRALFVGSVALLLAAVMAACTGAEGVVMRPDGAVIDLAAEARPPDAGTGAETAPDRPVLDTAPEAPGEMPGEVAPEVSTEAPIEAPTDLPADVGDVSADQPG